MTVFNRLNFTGRRKTPLVLQTEAAECGLACLAMIAGHYGHDIDLTSLRQRHSLSLKGATLDDLIRIAEQLHFVPRPIKLELEELPQLWLPAILHWDFNHFVVLVSATPRSMLIYDPAQGVRRLSPEETSRHFTGVAMELEPDEAFTPKRERRNIRLRQLTGPLPGLGGAVTQLFLLAAALEILAVTSPFFLQWVVDHALVANDRDLVAILGLGFLLLGIFKVAITVFRAWVVLVLGTNLNLQLFTRLFRRLLSLPMEFFEKRYLGDIVSRFESLEVIQRTLTSSLIEALVDGLMAIATLGMMALYSISLTLIVLLAALLYGLLRSVLYQPLRQAQEEHIVRAAKQQSNFIESVRGVQSLKLFNRQLYRQTRYHNLTVESFNAHIRIQQLQMLFRASNETLFVLENIAVIWLGALQVLDTHFTVGMLFAFLAYKQQFITRIVGLIEKGIDLKMLGLHTERVADIALTDPEPISGQPLVCGDTILATDIEVIDLGFRYADSEPWILRHLNMKITAGESVAIIGPSGCGKTTLLKLLLGLLTPCEGEIRISGISLAQLGLQRYREMIGTVMQDDHLFAGSISENISFFDPRPDFDWIDTCARRAALAEDIEQMPMQYNTLIGDMGTVLSGGQKQRLLLARALYRRPKILFLDEATSHLDGVREQSVNEAIRHLELTRVIVAHRQETIAMAGRVISLAEENG